VFHPQDCETLCYTTESWEQVTYFDVLELGNDMFGAWLPSVIDEVEAIPTSPPRTHLYEPRPDGTTRALYRDGMGLRAERLGQEAITWQAAGTFTTKRPHEPGHPSVLIPASRAGWWAE
jgi:hypothetical protein